MRTAFSVGISASALLLLVALLGKNVAIRRSMGGVWSFCAVAVVALGANAVIAGLPGRTSYPLGLTAVAFLVLACAAARPDDVVGGSHKWQRLGWWTYGVLLIWCFVVDVTVGIGMVGDRWMTYGAALIIWVGTGLLAGTASLRPDAFAYTSATLLALMTVPTVVVNSFWTSCSTQFDKCSPAGALFRSFATSENYIAIVAAFTLVSALTALRGAVRILAMLNAAIVIVATGSRTGMIAVLVSAAVALALAMYRRHLRRLARLPAAMCFAAAAATVLVAAYLLFTADRETLSKRGAIWLAVRSHIEGHLIEGVGVSKWALLEDLGESPQHFFHSGYALALFSGGLVAMTIFGAWLCCLLRSARGVEGVNVMVPLVALFSVYSLTEVIWNPLAVDGLTWLAVSLSCLCGDRGPVVGSAVEQGQKGEPLTAPQGASVSLP